VDFKEFRSGKVWIPISFGPEQGPKAEFSVAYCPAALTDDDAEFLAQLEHARLVDYKGLYDEPGPEPPAENRAQRRARERAQERAQAVPEKDRQQRPTYVDFMKRLVVDWDLTWGTDDEGRPVPWPVCEESFRQMEYGLRLDVVTSIMMDYLARPNLGSLPRRFSATTTASGPTGQTSAPEPSSTGDSTGAGSSPGSTAASPTSSTPPSGTIG
jgi:hypothetical protein